MMSSGPVFAMLDLRADLESLLRLLARLPLSRGARTIMFIAPEGGEGTSSIAASVAILVSARTPRSAWLVDLDVQRNTAHAGFERGFARGVGRPGRALDASLQTDQFYSVVGAENEPACGKLLTAHLIGDSRLLVTRFRTERLPKGKRVQMRTAPTWWNALRAMSDWTIVDSPPIALSTAGLAMVSQMDGVVLVAQADTTSPEALSALRLEVEAHGGKVLGVAMNCLKADARFASRFEAASGLG